MRNGTVGEGVPGEGVPGDRRGTQSGDPQQPQQRYTAALNSYEQNQAQQQQVAEARHGQVQATHSSTGSQSPLDAADRALPAPLQNGLSPSPHAYPSHTPLPGAPCPKLDEPRRGYQRTQLFEGGKGKSVSKGGLEAAVDEDGDAKQLLLSPEYGQSQAGLGDPGRPVSKHWLSKWEWGQQGGKAPALGGLKGLVGHACGAVVGAVAAAVAPKGAPGVPSFELGDAEWGVKQRGAGGEGALVGGAGKGERAQVVCLRLGVGLLTALLLTFSALVVAFMGFKAGRSNSSNDGKLRLNEIQILGSWRSYHVAPDPAILSWLKDLSYDDLVDDLNFTHPPLTQQLEGGYRFFRFDVYSDPIGGFFKRQPAVLSAAKLPEREAPQDLLLPGFKVMNYPDVDFSSTCLRLVDCLQQLVDFSDSHPRHFPIIVNINFRSDKPRIRELQGHLLQPRFASPQSLYELENEILQVVDQSRIITPDLVRGSHKTLAEAIKKGMEPGGKSWPSVEASAGKLLFLLSSRDAVDEYLYMSNTLEGRLMFTAYQAESKEGLPFSADQAVVVMEAFDDAAADLVASGHLVISPLNSVQSSLEAYLWGQALASGCQVIGMHDLWVDPGLPPVDQIVFPAPASGLNSDDLDKLVVPSLRPFGSEPQARCNVVLDPTSCQEGKWALFEEPVPE